MCEYCEPEEEKRQEDFLTWARRLLKIAPECEPERELAPEEAMERIEGWIKHLLVNENRLVELELAKVGGVSTEQQQANERLTKDVYAFAKFVDEFSPDTSHEGASRLAIAVRIMQAQRRIIGRYGKRLREAGLLPSMREG